MIVRPAADADRETLRAAVAALQERERALHDSRLPGEAIADAFLAWMLERAEAASGAVHVA